MALIEAFVLCVIALLFCCYKWTVATYNTFKQRGVAFEPPKPLLGNVELKVLCGLSPSLSAGIQQYLSFKNRKCKIFGIYQLRDPVFILSDPHAIRQIFVKGFDYFQNHRTMIPDNSGVLISRSIFLLKGRKWKEMRNTLTPTFTGSKIRHMWKLIDACSHEAVKHIGKELQDNGKNVIDIEMFDFFTRFTSDVIATFAFGIKINSFEHKNNEFFTIAKKLTKFMGKTLAKVMLFNIMPRLMKALNVELFDQQCVAYLRQLLLDAMQQRQQHNIVRTDMIQLLMEAQKQFRAEKAKRNTTDTSTEDPHAEFNDEDLLAQCMLFFLAGFDTVSTCLCFTAYELLMNPDENENFLFEFKKNDIISISIAGLHYDPEHFSNPEKFEPLRFSEERKHEIKPFTYMPFGIGPRSCIDLQSLWITSWHSSKFQRNQHNNHNNSNNNNIDCTISQRLQKNKFPLELNLYSNCNFDYQPHEGQRCHQQQQQQYQDSIVLPQEQSTLLIKPQNFNTQTRGVKAETLKFSETNFIDCQHIQDPAHNMDDMIFQCNNQNSIYVLNANYNSYKEFTPINHIATISTNRSELNYTNSLLPQNADTSVTPTPPLPAAMSSTCNFQHKLKTLRNFNSSTIESSGKNPIATSMSATMCTPATTALQKLFNCSSGNSGNSSAGNGGNISASCQTNQNVSHNSWNNNKKISHINNNKNVMSKAERLLNAGDSNNAGTRNPNLCSGAGTTTTTIGGGIGITVNGTNKKKCANVKSTLIAKKTKFLKYLEEEKWRNTNDDTNESHMGRATNQQQQQCLSSSNMQHQEPTAIGTPTTTSASFMDNSSVEQSTLNRQASNKNYKNIENEATQHKLDNWSVNNDSNNRTHNQQQQQQQQLNNLKAAVSKSSHELYQEAADILGLTCTLCDNCRCLDCQSGYFDCDDSDSYSEHSFMDDYDYEDDMGEALEDVIIVNGQMTNMSMLMAMHANDYYYTENWPQEEQQHDNVAKALNEFEHEVFKTSQECLHTCEQAQAQHNVQHTAMHIELAKTTNVANTRSDAEAHIAAATDVDRSVSKVALITATCSKILENCENFNDLSLLDAKVKADKSHAVVANAAADELPQKREQCGVVYAMPTSAVCN